VPYDFDKAVGTLCFSFFFLLLLFFFLLELDLVRLNEMLWRFIDLISRIVQSFC
jgi:hypothetical protein